MAVKLQKRSRLLKIRWSLVFIVLLSLVAIYINIPSIPVHFRIGSWKVNQIIEHPKIRIGTFYRDFNPRLGLDLQGGTHIVLEADMSKVSRDQRDQALELSRTVIERRVNLFGVSEPVIQTSKSGDTYRIVVELAGIKDVNQALATIGKTAKLEFRQYIVEPEATQTARLLPTLEDTRPTSLDGGDIESATADFRPDTGEPIVSFKVRRESQNKFYEATGNLVQKRMIIFLDDMYVSDPTVQQAIRDSGQITGQFTTQQTKQLALQLNAGALKAPVRVVDQRNVGATLGNDSIQKSITAGIIGMAVIIIFMVANYGMLGIVASLALLIYTLVTFAVFKFIPITLTLAGIAGFILSIGMAVDANILIFERMKEEIRWGKDKNTALKLGFERALSSIKASNISTIITTIILYIFGTGFVRGFALTLAIGVLISMFSAITVTKTFLKTFYRL